MMHRTLLCVNLRAIQLMIALCPPPLEFTYTEGVYYCKLCSLARGTKNWRQHIRTQAHQLNVQQHEAMTRLQSPSPIATAPPPRAQEDNSAHFEINLVQSTSRRATPKRAWRQTQIRHHSARTPRGRLEADLLLIAAHKGNHTPDEEPPIVHTDKRSNKVDASAWFPFKSKLDLVASLLIGHTRSMLSRSLYKRISALLEVCGLKLLQWAAVRESRKRIRDLLGNKVQTDVLVFDTPCYTLSSQKIISQELANPLVARHMEYYPESTDGLMITKFSQSRKWLTGMSQDHRPQMCQVKDKDFYIFEPVELQSKQLVIPLFFFTQAGVLHARCWDVARDGVGFLTVNNIQTDTLKIELPFGLQFHDNWLQSISAEQFCLSYKEIQWTDGRTLVDACAGALYGKS
ncbi:hypothetical protein PTTG_27904 [Puccinia triticina 1-1 BBBD Race 1]|uniref:U1-type domain-containing protein n=1 Tax=Puccinia triticina (isolate 1-1 / race 1 (BBBD)) TaxID=630390 RepID=A0A180GFX1_PUCT1|nr:hypothetical protein PTTG_27904 [Puccinia triticina 1-1 BBBD Race 1]